MSEPFHTQPALSCLSGDGQHNPTAGSCPWVHACDLRERAVLVIDSNLHTQALLQRLLGDWGVFVWTTYSLSEALSLLEQFQPDLILSSIELADGNGYALLQQWRAYESAQGIEPIPAIAMSTLDRRKHQPLALTAGFQAYLQRPFVFEGLLDVMAQLLYSQDESEATPPVELRRPVISSEQLS